MDDFKRIYCPITHKLMSNPVLFDGFYFEKEAIEEWLRRNNTNPITKKPITNKILVNATGSQIKVVNYLKGNEVYFNRSLMVYKIVARDIEENQIEAIKEKIIRSEKKYLNDLDENIMTPLYMAVKIKQTDIVKVLLEFGADTTVKCEQVNNTALSLACEINQKEIAELIIRFGTQKKVNFDINLVDNLKENALHKACKVGNRELVELLVVNGINSEQKNLERKKPVDLVCDSFIRCYLNNISKWKKRKIKNNLFFTY